MTGAWVPHDARDQVVDFVRAWSDKTEIPSQRFIAWLGIAKSKFHSWKQRYGKVFLESLPAYKKTKDLADVEQFFGLDASKEQP